jgi:WD40 repeat protein
MKRMLLLSFLIFSILPWSFAQAQDCTTLRLVVGGKGRVLPGDANNVRDQPSTEGSRLGQIPGEAEFSVLEGPVCDAQGRAWWQVDYNGLVGWTVGGQGSSHYVEAVVEEGETPPSLTPVEPAAVNCDGMPPRLTIGRQGRVLEGEALTVYSRSNANSVNGEIQAGGIFSVLDEPTCDSSNRIWWPVAHEAVEGWILEGMAGTYFVEPVIDASETLVMPPRFSCSEGLPTRLFGGGLGQVVTGGANRIRSAPSTSGEILGVIPSEAVFSVIGEVQCDDGTLWQSVEYNGLSGWTAEVVSDSYTVEPSSGGGIVPDERDIITLENLWQVTELARFLPALSRSDNDGFNYGSAVSWSPDSMRLAVTDKSGVLVYDVRDLAAPPRRFHSNMRVSVYPPMFNAAFSPDGQRLAAGSADGIAYVWDVNSGEQISALQHEDNHYVSTVAFSPDGRWLATGSVYSTISRPDTNKVTLWHTADLTRAQTFDGFGYTFVHDRLTFSPNSQQLIINERLIDLSTGEEIRSFSGGPAVFNANGSMTFSGGYLYKEGTAVRPIPLNIITDADFHPSGAMFLTASVEVGGPNVDDRGLRLWDGQSGTPILTLIQNETNAAAFSPDGTLLAAITLGRLYLYGIP